MNPWTLLNQGLGWILAFFYSVVPIYGIAIILLTLTVSMLLFPLTLKQTRSMKAMQEIQPQVKKLQKEYKADRQELNAKLMELYQERGVNPAAGCLPLLIQMPIWFALFRVLRVSRDALAAGTSPIPSSSRLATTLLEGDTTFLGMNLQISPSTASSGGFVQLIPYLVLILIVVAAGYFQSVQTMRKRDDTPQDSQQQGVQTAMRFMPVLFGVFSWGFPTGLVLYFATSNLFRVGQQAYILGLDKEKDDVSTSTVDTREAPEIEPRGPSPNASKKKRNRRRRK